MASKPLSPKEVNNRAGEDIPDAVIDAVNELLKERYRGGTLTLLQKDVVERVLLKDKSITSHELFENHWMDFEPLFRRAGWIVNYDKPGYCETYEPSFEFSKKK